VQVTGSRIYPVVTANGTGIVSHVGTVLLAEVADRFGLTAAFGEAMSGTRRRSGGHDPGRVLVDLAVAIADGAETITDLRVLSDQERLNGPVASLATAWRVLKSVGPNRLAALRTGRAAARERAWLARGELTGQALPPSRAAGRDIPELVIDVDATLVEVHSDKEGASGHFKGGFGYHPLLAFLDNTNEALAGILRPGRAGSNTAADHIELLDLAVAQVPDAWRDKPILVRSDGAGFSHALLTHLADRFGYSVGWPVTEAVRTAIATLLRRSWSPAVETDGELREGADVAELTGLLDLSGWPPGMRIIVRRERPHPGAQLSVFEHRDGYRYQTFATNTPHGAGGLAFLEARHRAHAWVEDRIRCAKDTGLGRLPSREMAINAAWLELVLAATDLTAWLQTSLLTSHPTLAKAEPKALRYRLLHTAARITRGGRRVFLNLAKSWPWAAAMADAFTRLRLIPVPG
jgi:Transposase DDE domain group 1